MKINDYLEGLQNVWKNTEKTACFDACSITDSDLVSILKSWRRIPTLLFNSCEFSLENEILLKNSKYKIKRIGFIGCGKIDQNNWSYDPHKLENLIEAFSKCKLNESLIEVNIKECGIALKNIQKMINRNGFKNVKVVDEYWKEYF